MRTPKTLTVLILTALLLAVALSMITVSRDADPDLSFTIPETRIGDQVTYALFDKDGEVSDMHTYTVKGITHSLGHSLAQVPALEVQITGHYDGISFDERELISLEDRFSFQWSFMVTGTSILEEWSQTNYSPDEPSLPGVALQGQTLALGETVLVPKYFGRTSGASIGADGDMVYVTDVELYSHSRVLHSFRFDEDYFDPPTWLEATVSESGTIDGEPALGVRLHIVNDEPGIERLTPDGPRLEKVEHTWIEWYIADLPYPSLLDANSTYFLDDGSKVHYESLYGLTDYEPGEEPITWGRPSKPLEPERSPPVDLSPADGTVGSLAYPLTQAVEDAYTIGVDPQWRLWQVMNPDARLVGATMSPGTASFTGEPTLEWRLVFQAGNGAYEVRTERSTSAGAPVVEPMGPAQVPHGDWDAPDDMLTLSWLADLWVETHTVEPTYIHWGLIAQQWSPSKFCMFGSNHEGSTSVEPEVLLRTVYIGTASHGPCVDTSSKAHFHAMVFDAAEGRLLLETESQWDHAPASSPSNAGSTGSAPSLMQADDRYAMSLHPPVLERGAIVAVPLLAVLLTVYFFPAISFAATKGLFFLPLFSRLKKSEVLDHSLRDRLFTRIRQDPGVSPTRLMKETGTGWGTIVHHLSVMQREGLIASRVDGRHRRFFVVEDVPPANRASLAVLGNARTQELYTSVLDEPGLATPEIAKRIGLSPPGALWHLKRLEENGLVERKRDGRYVRYYPSQQARPYDPREAVEVV